MIWSLLRRRLALVCLLPLACAQAVASSDFERLSDTGNRVRLSCNPDNLPERERCRVDSLPGASGFALVAERSVPLVYNEVEIGTLHEKVWQHGQDSSLHIFGLKVVMNNAAWDSGSAAFNVNDLFRQALPDQPVAIGYHLDPADTPMPKSLKSSGRTVMGLGEFTRKQPKRDNAWINFRVDANADDPDGHSAPASPWLLTMTHAPEGIELAEFGLRVLNSEFDDFADAIDFYTAAYQPVGVPPPPPELR